MYENWLHYGLFVHEPLTTSVRNVLHNISNDPSYVGLPVDPVELYNELYHNHKPTLKKLQHKGILKRDQMMLLFPDSERTYSENMQIPLLVVLIRNCTNLRPPKNGRWDNIYSLDQSKAANVVRARKLDTMFRYGEPKTIDKYTLDAKWKEGDEVVTALGYTYDSQPIKNASLDQTTLSVVIPQVRNLQIEQSDLMKKMNLITPVLKSSSGDAYLKEYGTGITFISFANKSLLDIVLKFRCFHNFTSSSFPCEIILIETIFSLSLLIFTNEVTGFLANQGNQGKSGKKN